MNRFSNRIISCALLTTLLVSTGARAEVTTWLPWLDPPDPFATEEKVTGMVAPKLKPDVCPVMHNLEQELNAMDVVIMALCHNHDTRAAYFSLLSQANSYATSYSDYLPDATASLSRSRTTSFSDSSKSTGISRSHGLSVGMLLYDFGQREFRLEIAEQTLIAAGYSYNSTLQGAIAAALQGYFRLLTSQNSVKVAEESERYARESYEAAALRHELGQVALADELQARGSYSQAKLGTERAYNQLALDQASLARLMGLPPDAPVKVAEMDDAMLNDEPFGDKVQVLMETALEKRSDLQATRSQLEGAKKSLQSLKRSNLATISATANLGLSNDDINVFSRHGSRSQAIGLSVSIPIFNGFSQSYSQRSAMRSLEAQEERLESTELSVTGDVWNTWHNYQTSRQSWKTSQDLMASATQLKEVALGRYKEGLGTILDVLNAQTQYSNALQSQLLSRYNLFTTRIDLLRAVGVLNLETMHPEPAPQEPVILRE